MPISDHEGADDPAVQAAMLQLVPYVPPADYMHIAMAGMAAMGIPFLEDDDASSASSIPELLPELPPLVPFVPHSDEAAPPEWSTDMPTPKRRRMRNKRHDQAEEDVFRVPIATPTVLPRRSSEVLGEKVGMPGMVVRRALRLRIPSWV